MELHWASWTVILLLSLWQRSVAATKAVFAHFIVDNAVGWDESQWEAEMNDAIEAKIDAFALNLSADEDYNVEQVTFAFSAAAAVGFRVFFSFDYSGNGPWAEDDVLAYLDVYMGESVYFLHDGTLPLVSTFEGTANAADWVTIKATYNIFFIPDWSSLGAEGAAALEGGIADGLFSWAAWSYGGGLMDTYTDAAYQRFLDGKPFMMAASPWFYTNLPEYSKNWLWSEETMSLWPNRWMEVFYLQPDYVEIISWNDFGESHYIGNNQSSPPFESGEEVYDYATNTPHHPLRWPLATWIEQYKNDVATVTTESLVLTYLVNDVESCDSGGTPVNTATQLQFEYLASNLLSSSYKYIGVIATLASSASATVTVGGSSMEVGWYYEPVDNVGVYYGYVFIGTLTGDVSAELTRDGASVLTVTGEPIGGCTDGYTNFNPWVAGTQGTASVSASTYSIADQVCVMGTGANYYTNEDFSGICAVTCEYGYCPTGACVCQQIGLQKTYPTPVGIAGYATYDQSFLGLCSWAFNYGWADVFTNECTTTETTAPILDWSPFQPPACTGGEIISGSEYAVDDLCAWGCPYGFCPVNICACNSTGLLVPLPAEVNTYTSDIDAVYPADGNFWADLLCNWPCDNVGLCPCDYPETNYTCDIVITYSDLDDLQAVSGGYDQYCNGLYVLDWLAANMTAVLDSYNTIVGGEYESYFDDYVSYIQGSVNSSIEAFMAANGTDYFSCSGTSLSVVYTDTSGGCPAWSSLIASEDDEDITLTWTLTNSDGFYAVLDAVYGINSSWVTFGTRNFASDSCPVEQCGEAYFTWAFTGYPTSVATDDISVYNPQSVFTSAGAGLTNLPTSIYATYLDFTFGQWGNGSIIDVVQVYQTAVSSSAQALAAMNQVEVLAKEIEAAETEEKKKKMILWIVTAVLFFVPFIGEEAAGALDLVSLARALSIAGIAGNLGLDIYSIIEQPDSAYMVVMGWLLGAGGVTALSRDADSFATMAAKRAENLDSLTDLGSIVDDTADQIQTILESCTK